MAMSTMRDEVAHFRAKELEDEVSMVRPAGETAEEAKRRVDMVATEKRVMAADRDQIQYTKEYPF
jgi:hypothetical protein